MRETVKNAWVQGIKHGVNNNFPEFMEKVSFKKKGRDFLLHFEKSNSVTSFITFRLFDSESFDVFVGWTKKKNITFSMYFNPKMKDKHCYDQDYFVATSMEISERSGASSWDFWSPPEQALDDDELFSKLYCEHFLNDLSVEEAEELVSFSVHEAVKEIKEKCIPYLNSVTEIIKKQQ